MLSGWFLFLCSWDSLWLGPHLCIQMFFCLLGFVCLRSPDIEGVPLPRDVNDSLNVSTFFRFSGRIFDACLLVKVY
jgi:hypothetical protein